MDLCAGCGSTIIAAEKLGRRWIGVDVSRAACSVVQQRLKEGFGLDVEVVECGRPAQGLEDNHREAAE